MTQGDTPEKQIEERFGKTWKTLAAELEEHLGNLPREKHMRLHASPQRLAVLEMVLADCTITAMRDFLRRSDPERFSPDLITDDALRKLLRRFADDVIAIAARGEEDAPLSFLDIYKRLPDGGLNIEQKMLRVLLVQESRLDRSLRLEGVSANLLPETTKELTLYFKFLMAYGHWQIMHLPYGDSQRECMMEIKELGRI